MLLPPDVLLCARAGHAALVLFGPRTGAEVTPWDDLLTTTRDHLLRITEDILSGCSPADTHARWAARMQVNGWTYAKTSPCLCPFDALPEAEKREDRLFHASVLAMAAALGG